MTPTGLTFRGNTRALVLCPHTDDEFGCAGTILRLLEQGVIVKYVAMSRCEESVPRGLPPDVLEHECRASTARLGLSPGNVDIWSYRVRHFPEHRQAILEQFVGLAREFDPQLVLVPATTDTHQDHAVVAQEGFRAFKHCTLLGYELPQNLASFDNTAFVPLSDQQIEHKIDALRCYASQAFRPYSTPEFIRALASVRGVQCQSIYAEAFEVRRLIL